MTLYNPPREDSASTIKETRNLGVDVKMITGDHSAIAQEIASQLNIGSRILTMEQVENDIVDKNIDAVVRTNGFAQVHPEDKYEIVDTLQEANYYIGMTGDGVNDAPALRKAHVGIAVSGATDAPQNPVRWNMKRVLTSSFILGALGVIWSFSLFLIAIKGFGLEISDAADRGTIMTFMFLKLSVAGHMTIYLTRSGYNHFWEKPYPSLSLFLVCEITQILATVMAVYGFGIISPIGWKYAGIIWGYAIAIFIVNDLVKVGVLKRLRNGFLKHEDWVLKLEPEIDLERALASEIEIEGAIEPEQDSKVVGHAKLVESSSSTNISSSSQISHT